MGTSAWYRDGLCFECTLCGNCCSGPPGHVWVTRKDICRIADFLGVAEKWLGKRHLRRVGLRHSLTEKPGGDCTFLRREGGKAICDIYPVRPLQCRTWPFWSGNLRSPKTWEESAKNCPGIDQGRRYSVEEIERLRTARNE